LARGPVLAEAGVWGRCGRDVRRVPAGTGVAEPWS